MCTELSEGLLQTIYEDGTDSVPKRWQKKAGELAQNKEYVIHNMAEVLNEE